jgi:UDP-N-acetylmuramyl pentapeptide phosphotransferase/UDP-N-acetylglucosamine-1-phosphate transferase
MLLSAVLRHLAFCGALALVSAMVVAAMLSAGIIDTPDARKAHTRPTPKGGGVGVVVAFMLGITVLYGYADFARLADGYFRGVILAAFAIAVVAFLDDLRDWPFTIKLAAQTLAALGAVGTGLYLRAIHLPYLGTVELGWAGAVGTLAWIVFVTNAMNFIDGLNGLAAGTALMACAFLAVVAAGQGGWFVYFAAMLLGAGLIGFLPFNFPRARIFLGDVGSQFCGFILAVLGVAAARFDAVEMSFLLVPCLLSGVLYDVAFTLVRRALAGERLTQPHRGHLYQVAHRAGMDARWVAAAHWLFAALGGVVIVAFVHAPAGGKMWLPLLLLLPQLAWTAQVSAMARRAGLGRW